MGRPPVSDGSGSGVDNGLPGSGDSGVVVLIVIAVTAALAVLVTITTLGAASSAASAAYRAQAEQADWLAESTILQAVAALGSGALRLPTVGASLRLLNGVDVATGVAVPVGVVAAPVASWPQVVDTPLTASGSGRGTSVLVTRVVGPDGEGRGLSGGADAGVLLDVEVEVWFRNARVSVRARLLASSSGIRRLH